MVQLLGQRQHFVVNQKLTKSSRNYPGLERLLKLMLTTPEVLEEEQLLINISIGK
jgi:hypothetical protein